ncbi:hypothetical protein GCM10011369_11780 [Neiella marina]|uniref:Pirin family protein n=1 Tax=Neiella marina TaxID=508461 RepID=A0A8J2U3V0_9GAMM|nr:pirin family protein [Neiella marina]GGA71641.1 hypothetical protein GCM10011369_11780 [Neiella marina]
MIAIRRSEQRGEANFGWLDSKHTFSFGHYYDADQMGFSALRVINDDVVQPGAGFDTHGHRNMEIISYVLSGEIEHKDSEGNIQRLPTGEFQLMSAGRGIYHSEYNPSATEPLKFLQIWIEPNSKDQPPSYQQKSFGRQSGLTTIVTPNGDNGTLAIKQDALLHQLILPAGESQQLSTGSGKRLYIHQVAGALAVLEQTLVAGDGAKIEQLDQVTVTNNGQDEATALIFELP